MKKITASAHKIFIGILCICSMNFAFSQTTTNTIDTNNLRFPIQDRRGDFLTWKNRNPFDISDTSFINKSIEYDGKTKRYYIVEKIGNRTYRKPTFLTFKEFYDIKAKQEEAAYFKLRADALTQLNKKQDRPRTRVYDKLFDRTFGLGNISPGAEQTINNAKNQIKALGDSAKNSKNLLKKAIGSFIDIKPTGNIDILMGYQGLYTANPTIPERARRTGGFDFDMNANVGLNANIGDKLRLPINYNTLANFDYLNQIKLDYKGSDDEILKSIEAGNVAFQSKGTLIPSAQNLFGIKTTLQFGKLFVTATLANQRSQRQNQTLQGGAALTKFRKKLSDYEENRHFLLSQYFKNNYNSAMSNLPVATSQFQIQRIEVWVTNRNGATTDTRDVVALMDLGENAPNNPNISSLTSRVQPDNGSNNLYQRLVNNPNNRISSSINSNLLALGLTPVNDYEKTFARKLNPNEYFFNPQVGFISLNTFLQPDEVLGVAFEYTYNGKVYKVGEFSQEVALDTSSRSSGVQKVLFLKMLKATSARINLPIWGLMMKNVYTLDMANVSREGFMLNVMYEQPSGGLNRYLPESDAGVDGRPLISLLNLDRLNNRNDPQPDGQFDFVENFTVVPQYGRIYFPVLEPFGRDLERRAFVTPAMAAVKNKYVFTQLYDSIKAIAQTYANVDRFVMEGQAKGSGGSDIYLGAFNIPPGSVRVNANGQSLVEGQDYTIDYNLGSVKILNQAIINSGVPVNVSYENNGFQGLQQRGFLGIRLDYNASKKLQLGATMTRLNERPFFTKMNIGDDPVRNTLYGVDFSYRSELPGLTRLLDKLPFYSTKTMSSINAYGEGAYFQPGHPPQIGARDAGLIYIDDFEGTRNSLDLRFPLVAWNLATTPQGNPKFPEASLTNNVEYNRNRAKLAWYQIEPNLQDRNATNNPLRRDLNELSDPRTRLVFTNELFPQQTTNITNTQTQTFDLSYYPTELGPYNLETRATQVNANGRLSNPKSRWGGLMRSIDQTDFETNNFEFVEFWMQDPFIKNPTSTGGKMFLNLGNISEDIVKDGKRFYENGMPTPTSPAGVDSSGVWGKVPVNPIQVTNAFSNDPNDRQFQDVGFDGLDDAAERRKRQDYLNTLAANFGTASPIYRRALQDPSNDNYLWFRDASFDASNAGILRRYKNYNNPQGNSPVAETGSSFSPATTLYPDNEDLNRDNTLNETEEYYEYQVDLAPGMDVGNTKYITDKRAVTVRYLNGTSGVENWYLFRVPIREFTGKVGNIPDFKAIRFMRMYLSDFEDSVTLRFARLDLVRNQWRQFTYNLDTTGSYTLLNKPNTTFNTLAVNLEENSARQPVNYVIPPGIERVQQLSNNGVNILQNEQALSMRVRNLDKGDARGVIKNVNIDARQFGRLSMFAHAESVPKFTAIRDGDVNLVVRIGQDFLNNYYEIKIPLKVTLPGVYTKTDSSLRKVWPAENDLDFQLQDLIRLKLKRNNSGGSVGTIFREVVGNKTFSLLGNPNLGEVRGIFIGMENAKSNLPINAEVWVNELRLSQINEEGGYAGLARVDVTLADLGTLSVSGNFHTQGFGALESKIQERNRDNLTQFDASLNIEAGKLLPKKANISLPVFASISKTIRTPQFDPYDLDVLYKDKISAANTQRKKDSIRNAAADQTTIKTINLTNVRVNPGAKTKLWSLSNFDVSFNYTQTLTSSPTIQENKVDKYRANIGYNFQTQSKYIEPFKKLIKSKTKWFDLIKDFNFNLIPSQIMVRADINRQMGRFIPRIVNTDLTSTKVQRVDTTYDKFFTFDRMYTMRWDLSRSLNFDFNATNNARVDEPFGSLDTKAKRDSVRQNFFNGGRNTNYSQKAIASYTIPFAKFPMTEWITGRYGYTTTYNWIGASLVQRLMGNTIENSQENNFTAQLDLTRLYSKSRFLRNLDIPNTPKQPNQTINQNPLGKPLPTKAEVTKGLTGKKRSEAIAKWRKQKKDQRYALAMQRQNQPVEMGGVTRAIGKLATMLKTVQINYGENYRSRVPGFMDSTQYIGQNFRTNQPGLDYVFGRQPDTSWLNRKAAQGLFSRDSTFNMFFRQNYEQRINITAQLEPIREFTIDLTFEKSFSKEYSQLFKDTISNNQSNFKQHLNPFASGGFSVSYVAFNTLFESVNPNEISNTFRVFQANRQIISNRLARENPYWAAGGGTVGADGYATGYGRHNQDVLIPAFIAAYTKQDPNKVSLIKQNNSRINNNPFSGIIPRPNWRLNYTGLSKIPALATKFNAINISHGYQGTLSMNSYTSALQFADPFRVGAPQFIDTVSGNYVPFFLVPNITIQESFQPLIGIDITTTKQLNLKFEYKKSRTLSLSLVDYQLSETNATEWTIGAGFRTRDVKIPGFLRGLFKNAKSLQNDLNLKLDLSMRDEATSNSRLDQPNAYGTGGQKVITIQPSIDYVLNNRINIKFFFDQRRVIPYIQTSAPNSNTRAGVQVRISLQ